MVAKPWEKYRVVPPTDDTDWSNECVPLKTVAHVAHVPSAIRICEDARLRADLIYDESKLNKRRIRVVWLSPNDWTGAGGFRYGSVRFNFDWKNLVEDRNYYWVEDMAYGVPACRILITDVDRSSTLEAYDPRADGGPWWVSKSGEHYWNGNYCLEIMVEGDVPVASATHVDFVKHHPTYCAVDHRTCRYRGVMSSAGGAEFIAALCGRKKQLGLPGLVEEKSAKDKTLVASDDLQGATTMLLFRCRRLKVKKWGRVKRTAGSAPALARSVLSALGNKSLSEDAMRLAKQFASVDDLEGAIVDAIASAVGLPDSDSLLDE